MNEIISHNGDNPFEIFNYKNLGSVRTYLDEKGEPWFCLSDVCKILGILNPAKLASRLNKDGITLSYTTDRFGRSQETIFVDEGNLYEAIGRSRKPEAKTFMAWVYRDLLPNLRKRGIQDLRNMTPAEKTVFAIQSMNEDIQDFKREIREDFSNHVKKTDRQMKRFGDEIAEMVAENKRIETCNRIGFRTVEAFVSYLGISPDSIDTYDFQFDVETRCDELYITYVDTYVQGFGNFKAYPFDVMMEVYEKKINT